MIHSYLMYEINIQFAALELTGNRVQNATANGLINIFMNDYFQKHSYDMFLSKREISMITKQLLC